MSSQGKVAYVTGGASGIGRAVVELLVGRGAKVFIVDRDIAEVTRFAMQLNKSERVASVAQADVVDWNQQAKAFGQAVAEYGRIDYVYPIAGIGERTWTKNSATSGHFSGFEKPNLTVLDIDVTGVLYTISLALQQFRRQDVKDGFRGKIGCIASICGIYCVPTLPIYTAAKHAITGFVRSYGKFLPSEKITLNAVNPTVIRTNISTPAFYDSLEEKGLLPPIEEVIKVFEHMLDNDVSGQIFEVGPKGGYKIREPPEYLDKESEEVCDLLEARALALHLPK